MRSTGDFVSRTTSRDTRPVGEIKAAPDVWYCVDQNRPVGPFTLEALLRKLVSLSNAADALVWCDKFSDWKRAGDVSELRPHILVPPPLPHSVLPQMFPLFVVPHSSDHDRRPWKWDFQWWWLIAALPVVVLLSVKVAVGNHQGRSELQRLSVERRATRKANKNKPRPQMTDAE